MKRIRVAVAGQAKTTVAVAEPPVAIGPKFTGTPDATLRAPDPPRMVIPEIDAIVAAAALLEFSNVTGTLRVLAAKPSVLKPTAMVNASRA